MRDNLSMPALLALVITLCCVGHADAQESPASDEPDKWDQSFTLYFWLPGQNGDIVVRGNPADVDTSISDSWDALSSLDGAFVGHYESRKGRWTILADLFYVRLEDTAQTAAGPSQYEPSQTIAELGTAYLVRNPEPGRGVEILGGLRYTELTLRLTGPAGASNKGDQEWLDPFVGARFKSRLSPQWMLWVRGDIGGFGIGDASDLIWNLILGLQYDLSERTALEIGWRWLDYDYDTGSGQNRFEFDVLMQGPFTGFTYRF